MADTKTENTKLSSSYTERIIFSQQFRSMQDKTQLFFPSQKQRVRTRLTHTIEVKTIARQIGTSINEKIKNSGGKRPGSNEDIVPADLDLNEIIAEAHDIGHTPFGHVGERTIDAVVSGEDNLGGLLRQPPVTPMRFKHNCNGLRVLVEDMGISDWRITEGTLAHTRIFYGDDKTPYTTNPYHPFAASTYNHLIQFIFDHNGMNIRVEEKRKTASLTLEGQIVAMADEIAQRAADLGDAKIQARYLDNIQKMFNPYLEKPIDPEKRPIPKSCENDPFQRLEWIICNTMIRDVADNSFNALKKAKPATVRDYRGISHTVYDSKIVDFSPDMDHINKKLEKFITKFCAQSEEVRESDSRAKYIIRQLYKAYINDVTLLPDAFLESYLTSIISTPAFKELQKLFPDNTTGNGKVLEDIRRQRLYFRNQITQGHGYHILNIDLVKDFFKILRTNNAERAKAPDIEWKIEGDLNITEKQKKKKTEHVLAINSSLNNNGNMEISANSDDLDAQAFLNITETKTKFGNDDISKLFDAFLLKVGFYIAGMTNTEAFDAYNKIYGHNL